MNHSGFSGSTLIDLLRHYVSQTPDAFAYTYLLDGEDDKVSITYAELDRQARNVAGYLQSLGMQGERALLLYPQGLEYLIAFWGCLYARVIAIPLYPPNPKPRSLSRIQAIAGDAGCKLVLSTKQIISVKKSLLDQISGLHGLALVATDTIAADAAGSWKQPAATQQSLAYLQYTSGSTSTPKGVMISHGNLLFNLAFMHRIYQITAESVFISWTPFFHDMGLIMGTLLPLYAGAHCILMSPASFAQKPFRWLQAISRFRGTVTHSSNFGYNLCVSKIPSEQRNALDLSCLTVAMNGAEPVRSETLNGFSAAFRPHGFREETFYPAYGLAEATLMVSCGHTPTEAVKMLSASRAALQSGRAVCVPLGSEGRQVLVSCGLTIPGEKVIIVDPKLMTQCPSGRVGEIWVSGKTVAQGYWGRLAETDETFRAFLSDTGEGPFLRTGDFGLIRDGELYVTGRLKDLIIIRGRNIYPQDVEFTVENCHPAIRQGYGAAFSVDIDDAERLVIVHEIQRGEAMNVDSIVAAARRAVVEEHEVQPYSIVLIKPGTIPKTSSGKIQRRACRAAYLEGGLDAYEL